MRHEKIAVRSAIIKSAMMIRSIMMMSIIMIVMTVPNNADAQQLSYILINDTKNKVIEAIPYPLKDNPQYRNRDRNRDSIHNSYNALELKRNAIQVIDYLEDQVLTDKVSANNNLIKYLQDMGSGSESLCELYDMDDTDINEDSSEEDGDFRIIKDAMVNSHVLLDNDSTLFSLSISFQFQNSHPNSDYDDYSDKDCYLLYLSFNYHLVEAVDYRRLIRTPSAEGRPFSAQRHSWTGWPAGFRPPRYLLFTAKEPMIFDMQTLLLNENQSSATISAAIYQRPLLQQRHFSFPSSLPTLPPPSRVQTSKCCTLANKKSADSSSAMPHTPRSPARSPDRKLNYCFSSNSSNMTNKSMKPVVIKFDICEENIPKLQQWVPDLNKRQTIYQALTALEKVIPDTDELVKRAENKGTHTFLLNEVIQDEMPEIIKDTRCNIHLTGKGDTKVASACITVFSPTDDDFINIYTCNYGTPYFRITD